VGGFVWVGGGVGFCFWGLLGHEPPKREGNCILSAKVMRGSDRRRKERVPDLDIRLLGGGIGGGDI